MISSKHEMAKAAEDYALNGFQVNNIRKVRT